MRWGLTIMELTTSICLMVKINVNMIDFDKIRQSDNCLVDGELDDGRLVEFKRGVPSDFGMLMPLVVAMANGLGGFIIFGVDEKKNIVGLSNKDLQYFGRIDSVINALSVGVIFQLEHENVDGKNIVILEIKKSVSTSFFSRRGTTPFRQIAYKFAEREGKLDVVNEQEMRYTKVYKYMTLDAFLSSLYCKSWRFFEPSKWNDRFEQRFYCANYVMQSAQGNTPQLFATCLTLEKNSEAAWKVYSRSQGYVSHCLQLELDIDKLRAQMWKSGYRFEEKRVEYKNENVILNLHKKSSLYYSRYFNPFSFDSFLNLLVLKRDAYEYEKELRLFIIPFGGGMRHGYRKAEYRDVSINWQDVILKVRVDKACSDAELASIQRACFSIGINPIIGGYKFIGGLPKPNGCKDVPFERFDIDEMPGGGKIKIR